MSWIFGVSESGRDGNIKNSPGQGRTLFRLNRPGLHLEAGGNPKTCFFDSSADGESGWIVVGTGIRSGNSHAAVMTAADWKSQIEKLPAAVERTDGHFVVLRWKGNKVECFTDQVGLRSLYFAGSDGAAVFSTRLDWVAQSTGRNRVDLSSLGSAWLLFNQIGYESLVSGIERLGPGGRAIIESGALRGKVQHPWSLSETEQPVDAAIPILEQAIETAFSSSEIPSLGLSGGLDSRLVLALLSSSGKGDFVTHNFGNPADPDSEIPARIAESLGISHLHLDGPLPDPQQCVALAKSYVARTFLTEPLSNVLRLRHLQTLRDKGRLVLDGGFGEIARRQYLNRVVISGKSAIISKDIPRLAALMRSPRSDFFDDSVASEMWRSARSSIESAIDSMPALEEIGIENYVDLFSVRHRVPNQGGPEQSLFDQEFRNYMPLVQPSFLRAILAAPVKQRVNGKLCKSIIRRANPDLARFPLVKSGMTYPYRLSGKYAWGFTKVKARSGKKFHDRTPDLLLAHLREYVLDLAHSKRVMEYELYDQNKLLRKIEAYYHGETKLSSEVDWWLAFELWRQSLA